MSDIQEGDIVYLKNSFLDDLSKIHPMNSIFYNDTKSAKDIPLKVEGVKFLSAFGIRNVFLSNPNNPDWGIKGVIKNESSLETFSTEVWWYGLQEVEKRGEREKKICKCNIFISPCTCGVFEEEMKLKKEKK